MLKPQRDGARAGTPRRPKLLFIAFHRSISDLGPVGHSLFLFQLHLFHTNRDTVAGIRFISLCENELKARPS